MLYPGSQHLKGLRHCPVWNLSPLPYKAPNSAILLSIQSRMRKDKHPLATHPPILAAGVVAGTHRLHSELSPIVYSLVNIYFFVYLAAEKQQPYNVW